MAVRATHVIATRILLVAGRGEATSLCTLRAEVALRVALGERATGKACTQKKRDPSKGARSGNHDTRPLPVFIQIEDLRRLAFLRFAQDSRPRSRAVRDHQCVAAAAALRVNLTFMGSLERAITNTGLFLPVVQLPVS